MNRRILFPIFKFNSYDIFPGLRFSSFSRSQLPLIIFYVTDSSVLLYSTLDL